jgi:release factor glutamine methyltransferase
MVPEIGVSRRALLDEATALLGAAALPQPRREAMRLWSQLTGEEPAELLLHSDDRAPPAAISHFRVGVRRRSAGEPLAYVSGQIGFRWLTLRCDRRALIPRPETEGLVDRILERVRTGRVADIGTGSGCLALSLASEGAFAQVIGIEASPDALALAEENRCLTGAPVSLVRGDLCAPLQPSAFDALVSNPPYLSAGEHATLDPSVRSWEPSVALVSGSDGLEATTRLLHQAGEVLRPGGWLALEVDCGRAQECARRAAAFGWSEVAIQPDLFGRERYLLARRSETQ